MASARSRRLPAQCSARRRRHPSNNSWSAGPRRQRECRRPERHSSTPEPRSCLCALALGVAVPGARENSRLLGEDHRLHAGNFETLAAAHILAGQHVVFAQHVGARLGEAGAVALIGASGELAFLGTHKPVNFIFAGLMAMRAVQRGLLAFLLLVEKVAFFHESRWSLIYRSPAAPC